MSDDHDRKRYAEQEWRAWYGLKIWKVTRDVQLALHPWCQLCEKRGHYVKANTVDHDPPHRGDWNKFCSGPFRSLCPSCHSRIAQKEDQRGYSAAPGPDGWPSDPRHPFNRRKQT